MIAQAFEVVLEETALCFRKVQRDAERVLGRSIPPSRAQPAVVEVEKDPPAQPPQAAAAAPRPQRRAQPAAQGVLARVQRVARNALRQMGAPTTVQGMMDWFRRFTRR